MQSEHAGLPFGEHTPLPSALQLPQKAKKLFPVFQKEPDLLRR
jgi:hypothetical protein